MCSSAARRASNDQGKSFSIIIVELYIPAASVGCIRSRARKARLISCSLCHGAVVQFTCNRVCWLVLDQEHYSRASRRARAIFGFQVCDDQWVGSTPNFFGEEMISVMPEGPLTGAYQGTLGDEQFLMSDSNQTRNTTLPTWTDGSAMYVPFRTSEGHGHIAELQSQTRYFGATPNCKPLIFGRDYKLVLWKGTKQSDILDHSQSDIISGDTMPNFAVTVTGEGDTETTCYARNSAIDIGNPIDSFSAQISYGNYFGRNSRTEPNCIATGSVAGELLMTLRAAPNATTRERDTCMGAVAVGWMRTKQKPCREDFIDGGMADFEDARANNTFMMLCQPSLSTGLASTYPSRSFRHSPSHTD
jgi:hypothetical protein